MSDTGVKSGPDVKSETKAMCDSKVSPDRFLFSTVRFKAFLAFLAGMLSLHLSAQQLAKTDVLSDLEYLRSSLEATHFDLYAYTSKEAFEAHYLEAKNQIKKDSLPLLEVVKLFQEVVANANNAHTRIEFSDYVKPYIAYFQSGGTVFPLEVAIENGKVLIRKNWSAHTRIPIGSELTSINGMPIQDVLENIYPQIAAERLYFKTAQLEGFTLPRFYWQVFGAQGTFEVEIVHNGSRSTQKLEAIKAWDDYEMKREDILKQDWELTFLSNAAVYLRPGAFGGDEEKYERFIDSAFVEINARRTGNLIIDLRNHPGGDDSFGDYLVSYIADKPFKWYSRFQLKSSALLKEDVRKTRDTTEAFWNSVLTRKNGEIYDYDFGFYEPQPEEKRYHGNVYVLVNRQSYSQSTVTAAQIQDYGFGQIVGEETAEHPDLFASIFTYELPKTGVKVDVPKGKIQRVSGTDDGRGVIPDICIKDHLLDEKDEILEGLLKRIEGKL